MYAIVFLLGSTSFATRDRATECLECCYPLSVPACLAGMRSTDPEIQNRCYKVLEPLERHVALVHAAYVLFLREKWDSTNPNTSYVNSYTAHQQWLMCKAIQRLTGRDFYDDTFTEYDSFRQHVGYVRGWMRGSYDEQ